MGTINNLHNWGIIKVTKREAICIMITFTKLFETLKENGISQYSLYNTYGISRAQIQRLKENQSVTTHTLNMILNILGEGFTLDDIAEFTVDKQEEE